MQLLEHQAKSILSQFDLLIPHGQVAQTADDIDTNQLNFPVVLKSQVPVGGRGKLGGIRLVHHPDEFLTAFSEVKKLEIKGFTPESVLIEQALDIKRELYLALRINRDLRRIELMASSQGGIDIEQNASSVTITSLDDDQAYETISNSLALSAEAVSPLLDKLISCFVDNDLLLLEINPLVLDKADKLICADAKLMLDDNALFRHHDYANKRDQSSIIPLGGNIGVIANGAGMAMSTMDTIYSAGGKPANFLDIGGGTGEDVFVGSLREISNLPGVTSIIINIFAGITRCDDIARGIIEAKKQIPDLVPLYIRLEGTNRQQAVELLKNAQIDILPDLKTCVEKALNLSSTLIKKASLPIKETASEASSIPLRKSSEENHHAIVDSSLFTNHSVIVQGITGHHGAFHTSAMLSAGTKIVAGVTPGKAGQTVHDIPVYDTVAEAVSNHPASASVIFVPARFARSAMIEAIDAGIKLIVCITEGIPVHDMLAVYRHAKDKNTTIIGPNCPGLIVPGSHKLGIIASHITTPGKTAIISRSGTLTYELADALTKQAIGQRIVLGIGGDPIQGMNFTEALEVCQADPSIDRIIMVGEIGGQSEQLAADYATKHITKPIYGLVVGHSLPPGQQFGHAGAIVGGLGESAREKTDYMRSRGIIMADTLDQLITSLT